MPSDVARLTSTKNEVYDSLAADTTELFSYMTVVKWLCMLNLTFFVQHITSCIFTQKLRRFYEIPQLLHITDLALFCTSLYTMNWMNKELLEGIDWTQPISAASNNKAAIGNLVRTVEFKYQYLFSTIIACLVLRMATLLQFNAQQGPLIKIAGKMMQDFFNFIVLYWILAVMFAIVGNINYIFEVEKFYGFFKSLLTILDASLGNYDFSIFDDMNSYSDMITGKVFVIAVVITFNILLLNLIIAILANTYSVFDSRSNGLYLSKVLSTRDELNYDECYGAFLSSMPPINAVQLPFLPMGLLMRYGDENLKKINRLVMQVQYFIFMQLPFSMFLGVSLALIPFAWLIGIYDKCKVVMNPNVNMKEKLVNAAAFIFAGPIILLADTFTDV